MARPSALIDDPTDLDAGRIDIPSRIGWLLRVHRLAHGVTLREMLSRLRAQGLKVSALARVR